MKVLALFLATAVAALLAGAAGAAPAPTYSGCGVEKKDPAGDGTDPASDAVQPDIPEADLVGAFVNAGGTPTLNLMVANLTGEVPPPATSLSYQAVWDGVGDSKKFVRAHVDFAGGVAYEYGHQETVSAGGVNNNRNIRDGETTGTLFPGERGVVQIVIAPEVGGKAGTQLKGNTAEVIVGRTTVVPGAVTQSPSRGLGYSYDNIGLGNVTIGACGSGTTAPPPSTTTPPSSTGTPTQGTAPLPVTLASKSIKKAKKGKKVKIKLKSSEPLTNVGVRIAKGAKAFGTGKLAKLANKGTVKVKLTKALKKGTYSFDVAGTDSKGARRVGSLKLRVK